MYIHICIYTYIYIYIYVYIYIYNLHLHISLVGGLLWNDGRAMGGQAGGGWVDCRQARGGWVRDGCRGIMKGVSINGYGVMLQY